MATAACIPVSAYLSAVYRPDCDYVDGEVIERNVGSRPHGVLQSLLAQWFNDRFDQYGTVGITKQRVQVSETRFRVPDVCVVLDNADHGDIIQSPPLVCIEVLSPDDRLPQIQERIDDYIRLGTRNIWIFDPVTHAAWIAENAALWQVTGTRIAVNGTSLMFSISEMFIQLERRLRPRQSRIAITPAAWPHLSQNMSR